MSATRKTKRTTQAQSKSVALRLFDIRTLNVMIVVVGALFFVAYLAVNNQASTKGFTIRELERDIAVLEDSQRRLDVETVSLQSMKHVEGRIGDLGMVPVTDVDYIDISPPTVAVK